MRNNLPPLRALRDFEAVARHKSLSAAARSLSITPAAVSRQITLLEGRLQCRLFIRHHRGLEITEKGRAYLDEIKDAFDRIEAATGALVRSRQNAVLSVRVYTTLATEWLIPRLQTFRERHPEIEIKLVASLNRIDFDTDTADVALLPMAGPNSSLRQDPLFQPQFTPVCSPRLIQRGPPLRHPRDLRGCTLLYTRRLTAHWQVWLEKAGVPNTPSEHGLWFESSSQAYQAARERAGVALGQPVFLLRDLRERSEEHTSELLSLL